MGLVNIIWYFFSKDTSVFVYKIPFIISIVLLGSLMAGNPDTYFKKQNKTKLLC